MKFISYCNRIIEYSFYSLFLLVPLIFSGDTSELFEFNKMWFAFGVTIIIAAAWGSKMVLQSRIHMQRTPLDIPILLFLVSQIVATLFSLDPHVSWWGYYSRFNGGLLSTITYIFLYYALVSNLQIKQILRTLGISLIAGFLTALWGFPAHFGYDPTCLIFRGTFDTSCWTEAFQPTIRTFSTLGQPAWFAAYLAFLLPLTMAYAISTLKKNRWKLAMFLFLALFFYINLLFANTRAGFIAFWVANFIFWGVLFFKQLVSHNLFLRFFVSVNIIFLLCTFFFGSPIAQLNKVTLPELTASSSAPKEVPEESLSGSSQPIGNGVTDSGDIRLLVWKGAIEAWKMNPLFGTGVETFAFAYYQHKSPEHNLTSEWDYLYNKAHNEYLNYLTTTGLFGLGSYLAILGLFSFFVTKKYILLKIPSREKEHHERASHVHQDLLIVGLFAGWISILISNFFGFSVVIMNLYLFLVPAFIFILGDYLNKDYELTYSFGKADTHHVNPYQWTLVTLFIILALWLSWVLIAYRQADIAYALGNNLDKTGSYQEAYPLLSKAVQAKPHEPVYADELSINLAALGAGLYAQNEATSAAQIAQNAIALSDQVVKDHPNNVVYWKNRVRLFYTLSATDQANQAQYLQEALQAINKAKDLAPTDAKIAYNQGILYGQIGELKKATQILQETTKIKPNYTDAYIALGLFYRQQAVDEDNNVINPEMNQKAIDTYEYVLENLSPDHPEAQKSLKEWQN
ncbi:MAG: O-antigen ligase family protein [Nitrososphaeraceae archaeon]